MKQAKNQKARFWVGVLYPENMRPNWQEEIDNLVQVPYAYCVHDKDVTEDGDHRKTHVHMILCFPNTTTYNHAMSIYEELNDPSSSNTCVNTCQRVIQIGQQYKYLIHDTEKSKGKHQYNKSERITGNNFDIGAYEQLDIASKIAIRKELSKMIKKYRFFNFYKFDEFVQDNLETEYYQVLGEHQSYFCNLIKGFKESVYSLKSGEEELLNRILDEREAKIASKTTESSHKKED
jgi:hypothetical protein